MAQFWSLLRVAVGACGFSVGIATLQATIIGNYSVTVFDLTPSTPSSLGAGLSYTSGNLQAGSVFGGAAVWEGPAHVLVNYHPAGWTYSYIGAGGGNQLVGGVYRPGAYNAALWNGSPTSFVNLNPVGSINSQAMATDGARQVGEIQTSKFQVRAGLWSGTADSFVDLHPAGADSSTAYAIAGTQQGGMAIINAFSHAVLWHGTADSVVDLTPELRIGEGAAVYSMTERQQVGYVGPNAALWRGSASSFVNLNPPLAARSEARATIDVMQAGFAVFQNRRHALLWFGSATDYVDLQLALDRRYRESEASSVWSDGTTIWVAGSATDLPGTGHPVLWTLTEVPEPTTISFTVFSVAIMAFMHRSGVVRWR